MKVLLCASVLLVAGCASNSSVLSIGKDTYMVSRQAATGFSGSGTLKAEAFQEATQYCEKIGKSFQVVNTHETSPPYIFGNFPKAEIQFMCLNANDAELNRPKLKKEANSVVEIKNSAPVKSEPVQSKDVYNELMKLDSLRKQGIITQAEFDVQKAKILNSN
ncbi:SHOCT domain-containing protein [Undibacterium sp. TS12]|uniref:SHOCT domain-containing protein n=1 Tax=Undibacterium sp. TS12 TaxID=2908202 RepID=UPI001F4D2194|nr:SHOCT domain-containing protein [Undibacterium sp. TS12]MCH8621145.1 SHOCT domain-containing protein [Undibacterium sp. TS12]